MTVQPSPSFTADSSGWEFSSVLRLDGLEGETRDDANGVLSTCAELSLPDSYTTEVDRCAALVRINSRLVDLQSYSVVIGEFNGGTSRYIDTLLNDRLIPTPAVTSGTATDEIRHGGTAGQPAVFSDDFRFFCRCANSTSRRLRGDDQDRRSRVG